MHWVPGPRPAYPKGLGSRRDPEDINKYGRRQLAESRLGSEAWPCPPEGPPPPSASLVAAPGGHDPVVG